MILLSRLPAKSGHQNLLEFFLNNLGPNAFIINMVIINNQPSVSNTNKKGLVFRQIKSSRNHFGDSVQSFPVLLYEFQDIAIYNIKVSIEKNKLVFDLSSTFTCRLPAKSGHSVVGLYDQSAQQRASINPFLGIFP